MERENSTIQMQLRKRDIRVDVISAVLENLLNCMTVALEKEKRAAVAPPGAFSSFCFPGKKQVDCPLGQ